MALPVIQPESSLPRRLADELGRRIEGEVRLDEISRLLYSTDASLYQIIPLGVVIPRHAGDVVETVRLAAEAGIPLLPRGSGTSLGGQTVGAALVVDFTPYMNGLIELNRDERWARVQPGVILDELNAELRPSGLMFAPDVATSNRASIGGMMGNNSSGAHSVIYGRTVDHVLAQSVVLADGSTACLDEAGEQEWPERARRPGLEGRIYGEVQRICRTHAAEVDARFPRIMRRVGGYNLDEIVRHGHRNLAKLTVGSEGTLATVVEARINLVDRPARTALLVSHFDDLLEALEATPIALEHRPAAVELSDRLILDLTRENRELSRARGFLAGDPEAILITEFYGESEDELAGRLEDLKSELLRRGAGYAHVGLLDASGQADVWRVRKAGVGVLMGMKGDSKPAGFVEDTAVAPERLADYIREFRSLLGRYGLTACYYAHASVGCLHVRPVLNLKKPEHQELMREISSQVVDLVLKYGGAMSAEHGDGLVRSEWQERMFGPELYHAFRQLKAAWDPAGIMNPGKIVQAPPLNSHLRYGSGYAMPEVTGFFDYTAEGGLARAVELCSGVGACRKKMDGVMCPSYRATLDEQHTTRARANMLRLVLSGQAVSGSEKALVGPPDLGDDRLTPVMDLCLGCKACKSECPSNVDVARLKQEFLARRIEKHGPSLRTRLICGAPAGAAIGCRVSPLANRLLASPLIRALLERTAGIDRRRSLPPYARQTFRTWFSRRRPSGPGPRGRVMLLADTWTNYHEPEIGRAAVQLLEAAGYKVMLAPAGCCGRPQLSLGLLDEGRRMARRNLAAVLPHVREGLPLLGLEPSCLVSYRDEYPGLLPGEESLLVAGASRLVQDFLIEEQPDLARLFRPAPRTIRLHGHCHQRAIYGLASTTAALRSPAGYEVVELPAGCCGMAGSFGFEREHFDMSVRIGELGLLPAVRAAGENDLIVAGGTSCRHQVRDATGRRAVHPVEALALALNEPGREGA